MKKTIAVMLTFLVSNLLICQILDTSLTLPNIKISASRISLPFSEESKSIEIIHASEIANYPSRDIAGILQYATGVDIRQRGAHGVQADIGIRGGGFEQTLILINGFKMTDPQTGHHMMNLPISPENILRIEIIKGPASRIYGQNAFAGVINIITKTPNEYYGKASVNIGQHQLLNAGIQISIPTKKSKQYFSLNRSISEGYKYNTDFDITNILYQNEFHIKNQKINLFAGYTERKFGANGFYASPNFMDQYEEIQTHLIGLQTAIINGSWVHKPKIYWRRNQDQYIFVRSNPSLYRNLHIGNNIGLEWNSTRIWKYGATGIGLEFRKEHLKSNNLGRRKRTIASIYAEHRFQREAISITPGFTLQYYTDFSPKLFYGLDAGYRLNSELNLYLNLGTTYRIPSYTERFYTDPINNGNKDLKPETAFTSEIGIRKINKLYSVQIGVFRRESENLIDWTRDTLSSPKWTPININIVHTNGLELSVGSNLAISTQIAFLGYHRINYSYINTSLIENKKSESRYFLENLKHQFTYSANFDLSIFQANMSYKYYNRVNLEDYSLVDIRLQREIKSMNIFLDINNIFNTNYKETNLVQMPGRWIVLGLSFKLF